ncbi:MAG TPA: hypothetical protein VI039_03615 [Solirubrobacterales bacterium]
MLTASAGAAGTAAWSPIAATGPTVIPADQSETQRLFVDAEGGTYTLTARKLAATGLYKQNQFGGSRYTTLTGAFAVGQTIEGPGVPVGTSIVGLTAETIELNHGGISDLNEGPVAAYESPESTAPIPYDASAADVQAALEALPVVGSGNVQVTGGPGNHNAEHPYTVSFSGALANKDIGQLLTNGGALVNGGATVHTSKTGGRGSSVLALMVQNIGGVESSGTLTYKAKLPTGFVSLGKPITGPKGFGSFEEWACGGSTPTEVICTWGGPVAPGLTPPSVVVTIGAEPGFTSGDVQMEVTGGSANAGTSELPLTVSSTPAGPGVQSFSAGAFDETGVFDTRAGGHPYSASTAIFVNTVRSPNGTVIPAGEFKDIRAVLPPGFLGNPTATPECPESTPVTDCPLDSMVGIVAPVLNRFAMEGSTAGVFNTEAPFGYPGKFRFIISEAEALNVVATLRSDEDYGLDATSFATPTISQVYGVFFTFWGEPAAASHDTARCRYGLAGLKGECKASTSPNTAFLTSATNCAEQAVSQPIVGLETTTWQHPGQVFRNEVAIPAVTGCENLVFDADFTFEPSDTKSDSTAAFRTSLTVPSEGLTDPTKLTTPEIKKTVVKLPKGVVLNASGADGLQACSLDQIGFKGSGFPMPNPIRFNAAPNQCPEASKIGTGELTTALLNEPLHGALYLAAQGDGNPFGSLFAIYLVIEDPRHGIFIKLPGRVDPSEQDGQMTVTFDNLPQVPFTKLDLNLKGGDRSALASPTTCGNYVTTAINTPWSAPESGPPTETANGFEINQGPNGLPCAKTPEERPFDLGWQAGSEKVAAGADGPFTFRITRPDGSQELDTLELQTPLGLSASLKGIPYCSDAAIASISNRTGKEEQSNPACPAASQVGSVLTGAGAGPKPFYTGGKLYLAGPYKGAPFSVLAVTPAVAGPFDLGNVVVRSAVFINRFNAQVTAKTDPIPQILKGVALRIKDVRIKLDHKDWTINPTSCEASSVKLNARGNSGASSEKTTRFQVGGCQNLAFGPTLKAHLKGGVRRGAHPAFTAEVKFPAGQANTKDVAVTLPHSAFLEQAHINTICTRVQAAAKACPQGSIYGFAEAETPLIDGKLTGPVFLKSSDHQLPDLAIALRGPDNQPVEVEFAGRIDSIKGQIRNTIEGLPDVPVTRFVLRMKGGRKGLLANSRDLCSTKVTRMTVKMVGHNNKVTKSRPPLSRSCKGKGAKKGKQRPLMGVVGLLGGW